VDSRSYFSRGKILISGEYAVLFGARALALPTRLGQHLAVKEVGEPGKMHIRSILNQDDWFRGTCTLPAFEWLELTDERVGEYVKSVLLAAARLSPGFFHAGKGYGLLSKLDFDPRWGLGSSSSLISNLAWWTNTDPYLLHWEVSGGSGYDIACARATQPLVYQLVNGKPGVEEVTFHPAFRDKLFFVYLGKKQDSQLAVREFVRNNAPDSKVIEEVSALTDAICASADLESFSRLITRHEEVLSAYLGMPRIRESRFPGFHGAMKSLGAWGGDMVLVVWDGEEEELRKYFETRGLKLIFRYDDLI